ERRVQQRREQRVGREGRGGEGGARRGRRRRLLLHGLPLGEEQGQVHPDPGLRAADRGLRDRPGELQPQHGRRAGLHRLRPEQAGQGLAQEVRLCGDVRHLFGAAAALALAVALTFLFLPILAIFIRVPPGHLYTSEVALDALRVTAKTSLIANVVTLGVGTPAAYFMATRRFPGRAVALTLIELPLVLPPAVAGVGLLVAFGRAGILGDQLDALGLSIPFTQAAVVMAVVFVAGPFYLRQAIAAFESV